MLFFESGFIPDDGVLRITAVVETGGSDIVNVLPDTFTEPLFNAFDVWEMNVSVAGNDES